jgi:hypothetical protein
MTLTDSPHVGFHPDNHKYEDRLTVRHRRPEEWITKQDVYPQLVDDATFSEAQR